MQTDENACGQETAYDRPTYDTLAEGEINLYENAAKEVEDALPILAAIHDDRTNEDEEVMRPLTHQEAGVILEMSVGLDRSAATLKAFEEIL